MCEQNTDLYEELNKSPLFKLSLSSKELFHSNFLEWLSIINREAFRKLINRMAGGLYQNDPWPDNWRVKREYHNFDLCVVTYDNNKYMNHTQEGIEDEEDLRILFVIENKVKSIPYKQQLVDYNNEAKLINHSYWNKRGNALIDMIAKRNDYWIGVENNKWVVKTGKQKKGRSIIWDKVHELGIVASEPLNGKQNKTAFLKEYAKFQENIYGIKYILLSLAKEFPEKKEISSEWFLHNYQQYADLIAALFVSSNVVDLSTQIIRDYIGFIRTLSSLSDIWQLNDFDLNTSPYLYFSFDKNIIKYNMNYQKAKHLRIHDLYQKLKFSYICTDLYQKIKKKYHSYTVFPSNQGGLFKGKCQEVKGPFICVNYTYLHGDPLLEINVHPGNQNKNAELYYTIQVQGEAFEHGIQICNNGRVNSFDIIIWGQLKNGILSIIPNWMTFNGNGTSSDWKNWNYPYTTLFLEKELQDNQRATGDQRNYYKYNMYDGTYLYQIRKIKNNPTIKDITDLMLYDLENLVQQL